MTGDRTTAKSSGGYNFSAKFKQGPFEVLRCDPVTGELLGLPAGPMSALAAAAMLARWGFDITTLQTYAVRAAGGYAYTGEEFLEEHAAEAVVAAWTVGAPAARSARQSKLDEWWPALASALNALEAKLHDEARPGHGG